MSFKEDFKQNFEEHRQALLHSDDNIQKEFKKFSSQPTDLRYMNAKGYLRACRDYQNVNQKNFLLLTELLARVYTNYAAANVVFFEWLKGVE